MANCLCALLGVILVFISLHPRSENTNSSLVSSQTDRQSIPYTILFIFVTLCQNISKHKKILWLFRFDFQWHLWNERGPYVNDGIRSIHLCLQQDIATHKRQMIRLFASELFYENFHWKRCAPIRDWNQYFSTFNAILKVIILHTWHVKAFYVMGTPQGKSTDLMFTLTAWIRCSQNSGTGGDLRLRADVISM